VYNARSFDKSGGDLWADHNSPQPARIRVRLGHGDYLGTGTGTAASGIACGVIVK
jgi:hypothetical protein